MIDPASHSAENADNVAATVEGESHLNWYKVILHGYGLVSILSGQPPVSGSR
jgi:hypothetical protein